MKPIRTKILVLFAAISALCCASYYGDENEFNSFFNPDATEVPADFKPFFYAPYSRFYDFYDEEYRWYWTGIEKSALEDIHVKAWSDWLGKAFSPDDIYRHFYSDSISTTFLPKVKSQKPAEFQYLQFLASSAKILGETGDYWSEKPAPNWSAIEEELAVATEKSQLAKDDFLKERFGFIAVKLAWQLQDPQIAISTYENLILPIQHKTYISDWARCRIATSYARLEKRDRALYEFAMVFKNCPSQRKEATQSVHFLGLTLTDEALKLAKNEDEKEAIYAIIGVQLHVDNLPVADALSKIKASSPWVKLIFSREVHRTEVYLDMKENSRGYYDSREDSLKDIQHMKEVPDYLTKLQAFAGKMSSKSKGKDQAFWLTAESYLHYLQGEDGKSLSVLENAKKISGLGNALSRQIAAQELLLLSKTESWMHPALEDRMIGLLEMIENDSSFYHVNARNTALQKFAAMQFKGFEKEAESSWWNWSCKKNDPKDIPAIQIAKAFMLRAMTTKTLSNRIWDYSSHTSLAELCNGMSAQHIQYVLDLVVKPNKTDKEERLVALSHITAPDIKLWAARRYMAEHQYSKAAPLFGDVPENLFGNEYEDYSLLRNPFYVRMPNDTMPDPHTPAEFAREMVELEKKAQTAKGDELANLYYKLGCGEFNMSYAGSAWNCVKSTKNYSDPRLYQLSKDPKTAENESKAFLNNSYITMSKALEFYEKSVASAENKEIKARSMYMAARCIAVRKIAEIEVTHAKTGQYYYDFEPESVSQKNRLIFAGNKWLMSLRNLAPKTRFHQVMLQECSLYEDFYQGNEASVLFW